MTSISSTVTAASVMLAAYGFLYNALKGQVEGGTDVGDPGGPDTIVEQRAKVKTARNTALLLGLVPLFVWLVFLKAIVEEVEAGFDVGFAISAYSPLDIIFVMLAMVWLAIACLLLGQAWSLKAKMKNYPAP